METEDLGKVGRMTNNKLQTREQLYFESQRERLDEESKRAIIRGEMQYTDADFYIRKAITGGTTDLLNPSNVRKIGITNLDKNVLPDLVNLVLSGVRMAYGSHATETDAAAINYSNTREVPAVIANGELVISTDDKPIVELPAARFFNNSSTGISNQVQGHDDIVVLKSLRLIRANQPIIIQFRCAEGGTLAAGKHYIEVRLLGVSNRKR